MASFQLSEHDIKKIEQDWDTEIEKDAKYWRENDAKLRAVTSVSSYEEFSEIVKAAHLKPLKRKDILQMHHKKPVIWNNTKILPVQNNKSIAIIQAGASNESKPQLPTTPAGFVHTWNKLDDGSKLILLKQMPLTNLCDLLQVETPPSILGDISGLLQPSLELEDQVWQAELLTTLTQSSRFSLNLKFLTTQEKEAYKIILENLKTVKTLQNKIDHVYKEFNL